MCLLFTSITHKPVSSEDYFSNNLVFHLPVGSQDQTILETCNLIRDFGNCQRAKFCITYNAYKYHIGI